MSSRNYLSFDDMCWPNPDPDEDFLTSVRYDPKPEQINYLMSVLGAYWQLVHDAQRVRNSKIARIRKHAVAARATADTTEVEHG